MARRKYTLPRHTNLASQGNRIGAFLIDLALFFALSLGFFYGCFDLLFKGVTTPARNEMLEEQVHTHLRYEENGEVKTPQPEAENCYETLVPRISYYYLNYLTGDGISDKSLASRTWDQKIKNDDGVEVPKNEYYTVSWFNKNVLGVNVEDPDSTKSVMFTYPKDAEGHYDKSKICIPKSAEEVSIQDIHYYLQKQYLIAYDNFLHLDYVYSLSNKITFTYSLEFVLSSLIASIITYIIIPWFMKNGQTVGKKVFKLGLATRDGYIFNNKQLLMRLMPLVVCLAATLIPVWTDIMVLLFVYLIIFLVSFALAMASPLKASLHDLTAQTIVVDLKTSKLFNNEMEEDRYLLEEDNIVVNPNDDENGEEPEISYEK